mgnify:CR=1 FL=1
MSRVAGISARYVVGLIVLLLVVAPFAAYTVPALVGADESYIVLTGSMRPAIDPGDVVYVSAVPAASVGVGDVITFDRGGDVPTTHRVIEVVERNGETLFRTQGDANEDPDAELIRPDQVIGVVTFSVPYAGSVMTAANSQLGFVALVVVPFALLLLDLGYGAVAGRREQAAAADGDDDLPAVYDPARAAESYYEAAEERLREAEVLAATGGVTARDMTASMLLAAGLAIYAGWNAYWQFDSFGAPRAETMSVLSGALVCLGFLGYLRLTADDSGDEQPAEQVAVPTAAAVAGTGGQVEAPGVAQPNGYTVAPPGQQSTTVVTPAAAGQPPAGQQTTAPFVPPREEVGDAE